MKIYQTYFYWSPKWEFVRYGKPEIGEWIWLSHEPAKVEEWQTEYPWIIVKEAEGATDSLQAGV